MTKKELMEVAFEAAKGKLTKNEARVTVDAIFDSIVKAIVDGEEVKITGLGTFKVKEKAARSCRNPSTGEMMNVPARKGLSFQVTAPLKKELAK